MNEIFNALWAERCWNRHHFSRRCDVPRVQRAFLEWYRTDYIAPRQSHTPIQLRRGYRIHRLSARGTAHLPHSLPICAGQIHAVRRVSETGDVCFLNESIRAAKRFFEQLRRDRPHLPLIITEDAPSSNAPHIEELIKHDLHYILGVKEGDHAYLFEQVAHQRRQTTEVEIKGSGVTHQFRFINQIGLNQSNPDLRVNFVEYWEVSNGKIQHFSWITDFRVTRANVFQIMRGGRARWKIENETFNTLKNQGYHFEHNFGHGEKNLSVVFALLMMLAFLVDQTQQVACRLFQAVLNKIGCRTRLWEDIRSLFHTLPFDSMESIYRALLHGFKIEGVVILDSG